MTDLYGNLLAIADRCCTRYLVQIRNNHGGKAGSEHTDLQSAVIAANNLVRLGWSVAIVQRIDTLIELQGKNPPEVHRLL